MDYHKTNQEIIETGFISKDKILEYVTQADIFQLVFGFQPVEFDYITSPFRIDATPGCWFEIDMNTGKLRFTDFADNRIIKGVKMRNIDCFDAVMIYFELPNFFKTLEFIKKHLIDGKEIKHNIVVKKKVNNSVKVIKPKVNIMINTRNFLIYDRNFWTKRYNISKADLIEDKVFPISKFKIFNTKSGDHLFRTEDISYAYTEFKSGAKKIYRPKQKGAKKFITNCTANDVGGMLSPIKSGRLLILTKSYKDFRVLKNLGLNVRWLQNEGMYPDSDEFWDLIKNFDKVIIFYDNDQAGIEAARKFVDIINFTEINKASYVHLPKELVQDKITDPSDLTHKKNEKALINFLKSKNILK